VVTREGEQKNPIYILTSLLFQSLSSSFRLASVMSHRSPGCEMSYVLSYILSRNILIYLACLVTKLNGNSSNFIEVSLTKVLKLMATSAFNNNVVNCSIGDRKVNINFRSFIYWPSTQDYYIIFSLITASLPPSAAR
jgi:hypothetical protein